MSSNPTFTCIPYNSNTFICPFVLRLNTITLLVTFGYLGTTMFILFQIIHNIAFFPVLSWFFPQPWFLIPVDSPGYPVAVLLSLFGTYPFLHLNLFLFFFIFQVSKVSFSCLSLPSFLMAPPS